MIIDTNKCDIPRILVITRNLPPLTGGMERLLWHTCDALSQSSVLGILGPAGAEDYFKKDFPVWTIPVNKLSTYLPNLFLKTRSVAKSFNPDIILSGSGLTIPAALFGARISDAKVISWLHGLDIVAKSTIYQKLFVPYFKKCDRVIVNSSNTKKLAVNAGVKKQKISILHPGVIKQDESKSCSSGFLTHHGLKQNIILLSVGRLTKRKGLLEFVKFCLPEIKKKVPNVKLVIVGEDAEQAVKTDKVSIKSSIVREATNHCVQDALVFLGKLDEAELNAAYSSSDLHVFPVKNIRGDVEGFGMVALEAAANGLPTVAFNVGGISDAVKNNISGWLVEEENYTQMSKLIINELNSESPSITASNCREYAADFDWATFGEKLRWIIKDLY